MELVRRSFVALVAVALAMSAARLQAGVIQNISTGINPNNNTLLPNGSGDAAYVIGPGGTGGQIGATPQVQASPIPATWVPDGASTASRWLALPGTGLEGISVSPGTYFFNTTVNVAGFNPSSVQISGLRYSADNKLIGILVNGTSVFSQDGSFAEEFTSFHNVGNLGLGLFHSGMNTISFEVANQGGDISPVGLRVEADVTGTPVGTPEPSTLLMLGLGTLIVSTHCARKRRIVG
jgi:hypothetical protein